MTETAPPTPKGQATRAHLIDVAARVFAERGYAATSFSELIAESGLTKGAFYFYFSSKAELARVVIAEQDRRWVAGVRERLLAYDRPREKLAEIIPAMIDLLAGDPGAWSVVRLVRELGDDSEGPIAKPLDEWLNLLSGIISDGQQAGEIRVDVDPGETAVVLVGAFDGLKSLIDSTSSGDERLEKLRRHARTLADIALAGLDPDA